MEFSKAKDVFRKLSKQTMIAGPVLKQMIDSRSADPFKQLVMDPRSLLERGFKDTPNCNICNTFFDEDNPRVYLQFICQLLHLSPLQRHCFLCMNAVCVVHSGRELPVNRGCLEPVCDPCFVDYQNREEQKRAGRSSRPMSFGIQVNFVLKIHPCQL